MEYKTEIPKKYWSTCKICKMRLKEMPKKPNQYFTTRFCKHLLSAHTISIEEYLNKYEDIQTPMCPCGCGKRTGIKKNFTSKMIVNKFIKFHSTASDQKFKESVERSKITRLGSGNPMFGKKAWNNGLTKHTDSRINQISQNRKGIQFSNETLNKMSESAKKRLIHSHTGYKHSEETKKLLAAKTIEMIKRGVFLHTKTKPHIAMSLILDELQLSYEEEQSIEYWLFDFLLMEYKIYIEVDGDYWHSNPKFYPNGPKTKGQKVNFYRDKRKNKYCLINNIHIVRFWEYDVLKNRNIVKQKIKEIIDEKSKNNKY